MRSTFLSLIALSLSACATVSADSVVSTPAAISAAEEAGAREIAAAEIHLTYAEEQYAEARHLLGEGDEAAAERMLKRAEADANLALEIARLESTRAKAREAVQRVEKLREQAAR